MQLALRPLTTAGIALVGAGVIAVSPLAPPPAITATPTSTAPVALTASSSFVDPIAYWGDVLELTGTKLSTILNEASASPFPVLSQVIENQTRYANTIGTALATTAQKLEVYFTSDAIGDFKWATAQAWDLLAQGDVAGATSAISGSITRLGVAAYPMLPMLAIPYEMGQNAVNILKALSQQGSDYGITAKVGFGLLGAAQQAAGALANTVQTVIDAAETGDPISIASAIVNSPAHFTDTWLNGPVIVLPNGKKVRGAGFLNLSSYQYGLNWNPISALIFVPRAIAAAITPPPTAPVTTAQLDSPSATIKVALPAGSSTAEDASAAHLAVAAEPSSAPATEPDTPAAASVSPQDTTELSDGTKTEPREIGAIALRQGHKLKASLKTAAGQADKGRNGVRSDLDKTIKKVTDRLSKVGKKTQAGVTSSSAASSDKKDKTGSDD
ncbi:hypothetical protein ABFW14_05440 [Mycolicibacterium fortuitum]|uniref:hypothetical protein n=1 Tax=Mycolicibacterium TaxID=1866885 RepID=UPI000A925C28|nr:MULTISPECIES: hypothetical protein [Mycolicibacterium]NOP95633.1 hypothetical protein [Mycolicibacterium fortuitum]UBV16752.1 hypothetical protein H8Z57_08080 [Mycolicibacterium fortuitum]